MQSEKYEDFPDCYRTRDFAEWLPVIKGGKRPSFRGKDWWPFVEKYLPFVNDWQKEEHEQAALKRPEHIRDLARRI